MNSGLHAADFINTVSRTFLKELVEGYFYEHDIMSDLMRNIIIRRHKEACAVGIRNAPPALSDPRKDPSLTENYWFEPVSGEFTDIKTGKSANKAAVQQALDLNMDPDAPLLFWPSRIARPQKGFELLLDIVPHLINTYAHDKLQIGVVANGEQELITRIKKLQSEFQGRVSYRSFDRDLSQQGMAGADFILMPSLYEPCGTPQVVGQLYGSPPIVRKTGGLADTVHHLSHNGIDGSGFVFEEYNCDGFLFAIKEAIDFHRKAPSFKLNVLTRIMREAEQKFSIRETARKYVEVYEEVFDRAGQSVKVV
jgi:glycogen synthase